MHSPFTKITYILTFPFTSLEQFLRAIWDAVSQAIVLILLQIELKSQLPCCAFSLSQHKVDQRFLSFDAQYSLYPSLALVLLPEKQIFGFCYLNLKNWNHPLVGIEPKDTTKPESRRRKDLSRAASKEDTGDLSESRVWWQQSWGSLRLRIYAYPWRRLSRGEFSTG